MIDVWRVFKAKHRKDAFTGEGARLFGGRWNSIGVPMLYTAEHISLAMLEILVHTKDPIATTQYLKAPLQFDESSMVKTIRLDELPAGWDAEPPSSVSQSIGDAWARKKETPVLRVPSAVVPEEWNYIIDPSNLLAPITFGEVTPCRFDPRLDR